MKIAIKSPRVRQRFSFRIVAKRKEIVLSIFCCMMLTGMMSADLLTLTGIPFVDKADEILGIAAWAGTAFYIIFNRRIPKEAFHFMFLLAVLLCIGFLGNVFSGVTYHTRLILSDGFLFSKPYIIFIFMMLFLTENVTNSILHFLRIMGKMMLWILAICAVISRFFPALMNTGDRTFIFLSQYSGAVSWWTILFLAVVWTGRRSEEELICYIVLSGIIILSNQSGLGMIFWGVSVALCFFVGKKKRIKWYYIAAGCVFCFWLGKDEMGEYLFNEASPRALLLKYAFVTANHYLPLGAGFATYGSSSAIRDYSALYRLYGFNKVPGMTEGYHPYLMDNYYQQVIGQLGYPGIILLACFMIQIIKRILIIESADVRNAALLLYGCLVFAGIGFGTASSWGCSVYMLLPLFFAASGVTNRRDITEKQSPLKR